MGLFSWKKQPQPMDGKPVELVAKRFACVTLMFEVSLGAYADGGSHMIRDPERRAMASTNGRAGTKAALDVLVELGLTPHDLEPAEREIALGVHSGKLVLGTLQAGLWRLEGAPVLAWALGWMNAIPEPNVGADPKELVALLRNRWGALGTTRLRERSALLNAHGTWSQRWFMREQQPPDEVRSRILERARALRWLVEPDLEELCTINMFR